ncbi:hypothetical protein PBI_SCTP2_290 [Salicola phage SCTP-2]|nr:hypothetical protein PBI_SCTP2_290 [Salicola phage SCTP-2]
MNDESDEINVPLVLGKKYRNLSFNCIVGEQGIVSNIVCDIEIKFRPIKESFNNYIHKVDSFLNNLNGSFFIPTQCDRNIHFFNGSLNCPSVEMPVVHDEEFGLNEIMTILFYKMESIMNGTCEIEELIFRQLRPKEIELVPDVHTIREYNPLIEESVWVKDINTVNDPETGEVSELDSSDESYEDSPWWRRPNGEVRDFFYGAEDGEVVYSYPINLGDSEGFDSIEDDSDDSPENPDNSEGDDDPTVMKFN